MQAKCFVCGWSKQVTNPIEANDVLGAHEDEAQHPNVHCPDCRRPVPTHNGKFPEHFRPVKPYRNRLVRCDQSEKDIP